MKKNLKKYVSLFLILALSIGLTACGATRVDSKAKNETEVVLQEEKVEEIIEQEIEELEPAPEDKTATITSFGDTLVHSSVYNSSYNSETGTYDFSPIFRYVEKYLKNSDLNIGNSESSFAGAERGYSGYPCFNCPEELATDLKELGVDVMTTANNHSLDCGFKGITSTLDFLDQAGISHTGSSRTQEEQDTILFKDLNGIKTAILAFTYGTNGIPIPEGKEFCVNLIDEDLILKQIQKAKSEGAECIIVAMHWGIEYQTLENQEQDRLAEFLISNDVNIVLGCHPHVLQPMKMVKVETEEGKEKEGLVIFSQGNFFSAQTRDNTRNTAIFNIEIKKDGVTNEISVEKVNYIPLYEYDYKTYTDRYVLLDLEEIIQDYENENGINQTEMEEDATTKETWSESMYELAKAERDRCCNLIGPEIDNTIEKTIE